MFAGNEKNYNINPMSTRKSMVVNFFIYIYDGDNKKSKTRKTFSIISKTRKKVHPLYFNHTILLIHSISISFF